VYSAKCCLISANRDPIVKILGAGFATTDAEDSTVIRMVEKVSLKKCLKTTNR